MVFRVNDCERRKSFQSSLHWVVNLTVINTLIFKHSAREQLSQQVTSPATMTENSALTYLNNSRVLWQGALRLWWLTDSQVFNVAATEYDVLEHLIARRDGPVRRSVLCAKGANCTRGKGENHETSHIQQKGFKHTAETNGLK